MENKIIAVDYDGTLAYGSYPECGKPNMGLIEWLKECRKNGCKIILWTMREGKYLDAAVEWCKGYGLEFDAINDNLPEMKEKYQNNPRKVFCDYYVDDTHFTSEYLIRKATIESKKEKPKARIF